VSRSPSSRRTESTPPNGHRSASVSDAAAELWSIQGLIKNFSGSGPPHARFRGRDIRRPADARGRFTMLGVPIPASTRSVPVQHGSCRGRFRKGNNRAVLILQRSHRWHERSVGRGAVELKTGPAVGARSRVPPFGPARRSRPFGPFQGPHVFETPFGEKTGTLRGPGERRDATATIRPRAAGSSRLAVRKSAGWFVQIRSGSAIGGPDITDRPFDLQSDTDVAGRHVHTDMPSKVSGIGRDSRGAVSPRAVGPRVSRRSGTVVGLRGPNPAC
jgi:hypothetical protein